MYAGCSLGYVCHICLILCVSYSNVRVCVYVCVCECNGQYAMYDGICVLYLYDVCHTELCISYMCVCARAAVMTRFMKRCVFRLCIILCVPYLNVCVCIHIYINVRGVLTAQSMMEYVCHICIILCVPYMYYSICAILKLVCVCIHIYVCVSDSAIKDGIRVPRVYYSTCVLAHFLFIVNACVCQGMRDLSCAATHRNTLQHTATHCVCVSVKA